MLTHICNEVVKKIKINEKTNDEQIRKSSLIFKELFL